MNVLVLTYDASPYRSQSHEMVGALSAAGVVINDYKRGKPIGMGRALAFQVQLVWFEIFRLLVRGFSMGQVLRLSKSFIAIIQLIANSRARMEIKKSLDKSLAVRRGHQMLWSRALELGGPCLLLEDDAILLMDSDELLESLRSLESRAQGPLGVELSQSFQLHELGISKRHRKDLDFDIKYGNWIEISPGASNTTCAAYYNEEALRALSKFETRSRLNLIPIDYLIDYFYLCNSRSAKNFHLLPGAFAQGSNFRNSSN